MTAYDPSESISPSRMEEANKMAMVLTDQSMGSLAKDLGKKGLLFCLYLSIPTTRVVIAKANANLKDLGDQLEFYDATKTLLLDWKNNIKKGCKDKDKVGDILRAFIQWGRPEWSELFLQKHKDNEELLPDTFMDINTPESAN